MLELIWRSVWAAWVREARIVGHRQAEPGCNTSARSTNEGEIIILTFSFHIT